MGGDLSLLHIPPVRLVHCKVKNWPDSFASLSQKYVEHTFDWQLAFHCYSASCLEASRGGGGGGGGEVSGG